MQLQFICKHSKGNPCVYFAGNGTACKYKRFVHCGSSVARVNKMTLALQQLTGKKK